MPTSSELYKRTRNWENVQLATFINKAGKFDIPKMVPVTECAVKNWIGFNFARGTDKEERPDTGLHFYLDDYQFQRVWSDPERYISMLKSYAAVMSPDFSIYDDFPMAVRIWNTYRNAWLACFWQCYGITVIPTIMWSMPDTYDWCFDGYPTDSIVSVSTEGAWKSAADEAEFRSGYREMLERLHPSGIILHGKPFDHMGGNIICQIDTMTSKIKKRAKERGNDNG